MSEDVIGKLFLYIMTVIAIFITPLVLIFNNIDSTQRSYIDNTTQVFVEQVRSTGYISKESYSYFIQELYRFGGPYKVSVMHKSKTIVPYEEEPGEYRTAYKYYNLIDIEEVIFNDEDYVMKDGDYISVTVKSINETIGSKVYSSVTGTYFGEKIYCSAGGMIGNTKRK